jgi:ABC-type Mn2+/Zn2+ transport system ATPase subunit
MTAAIACSDLSFSWPDGAPVLSGLTVSFGPGRTGLIGVNGSGKTTLLRAIAGLAVPPGLQVRRGAVAGYLPQRLDVLDGALLVASHDVPFLRSAGISRWLRLDRHASLAEIEPL